MKTKNKAIIPIILVSSAVLVLFSFKSKIFLKSINKPHDNNSPTQNLNQTDEDADTPIFQKLSVFSNRCRGCGKCAKIDPEHFELIGGKASFISTVNLNSSALNLAIKNCPGQAIILEQ